LDFKQTTTTTSTTTVAAMVKSKNKSVLDDLVQTRLLLTQKLKSMKSNEMDRINMLENTFKPITKHWNVIAENFLKKNKMADKYQNI